MQINTGISDQKREAISLGLATLLANTYTLYTMTQHCHWNVTGQEFFQHHILFEKQYGEMAEAVDEIAERIRALGYYVDGTFTGFKKLSTIEQVDKVMSAKEMLAHLIQGHEILIRHARKLAETADADGDFATVDMLGRRLGAHEKMAWFLRAST